MGSSELELPARGKTTITHESDWIFIEQERGSAGEQQIALHIGDLPKIIDFLCDVAGVGGVKPDR